MANTYYKISFGGTVAGKDIWSNSLHYITYNDNGAAPEFGSDADLKKLWDAVKAAYCGDSGMPAAFTLDYVKVAAITQAGKYVNEAHEYSEGKTGSSNQIRMPVQLTVAVTLETGKRIGFARRGRIFPPGLWSGNLNENGTLAGGPLDAYAAKFQTLINAINNIVPETPGSGKGGIVVVFSNKSGAYAYVTDITVGSVVDTQRRRRNKFVETRVSKEITNTTQA